EDDAVNDLGDVSCNPCRGNVFTAVGEMLERGLERTVVKEETERGVAWCTFDLADWGLWDRLRSLGGQIVGSRSGWCEVVGVRLEVLLGFAGGRGVPIQTGGTAPGEAGLHL